MKIATELHAPLRTLMLAHQRLVARGGHADICAQLLAALEHIEDLRLSVQELEHLAARFPGAAMALQHELPQRDPSLAELDAGVVVSLDEAKRVRRGLVAP